MKAPVEPQLETQPRQMRCSKQALLAAAWLLLVANGCAGGDGPTTPPGIAADAASGAGAGGESNGAGAGNGNGGGGAVPVRGAADAAAPPDAKTRKPKKPKDAGVGAADAGGGAGDAGASVPELAVDFSDGVWLFEQTSDANSGNWDGSRLTFTSQIQSGLTVSLEGRIDWTFGGMPFGTEHVRGTYVDRTSTLTVDGYQTTTPLVLAHCTARYDETMDRLVNGVCSRGRTHLTVRWSATGIEAP